MIVCGWCGLPTRPGTCASCGRDAVLPWTQRGTIPPTADTPARQLARAAAALGHDASAERIAEYLEVSPRTVRRWREMSAARPSDALPPA